MPKYYANGSTGDATVLNPAALHQPRLENLHVGPYHSLADAVKREPVSHAVYVTNLRVDFQKVPSCLVGGRSGLQG